MNKYEFKNVTDESADLYIYGNIETEKQPDFWTGEKSELDVDLKDFKGALDGVKGTLNIYINSGGGSVFAADAMTAMLQRAKEKGVKVHAYIDGLCASAATFIAMVADEIHVYRNSIMMIHKPIGAVYGNATEMRKMINTLDVIESSMLNLYEHKAKVDRDRIKSMVDKETWLDVNGIAENFNVDLIDGEKKVAACADLSKCGYNIPAEFAAKIAEMGAYNKTPAPEDKTPQKGNDGAETAIKHDYSVIENIINKLKGETDNDRI